MKLFQHQVISEDLLLLHLWYDVIPSLKNCVMTVNFFSSGKNVFLFLKVLLLFQWTSSTISKMVRPVIRSQNGERISHLFANLVPRLLGHISTHVFGLNMISSFPLLFHYVQWRIFVFNQFSTQPQLDKLSYNYLLLRTCTKPTSRMFSFVN